MLWRISYLIQKTVEELKIWTALEPIKYPLCSPLVFGVLCKCVHGIPEIYKQKKIYYPSSTFCHHLPLLRRPCYMLANLMSLSSSWNIRWMNGWMPSHLCSQFSIIHYNGVEIGKERLRVKSTNHWESSCKPLLSKLPTKSFTQLDENVAKTAPHEFFPMFWLYWLKY